MPTWLEIAKSLPYGAKRKVKHCATDRSMLVSHGDRGFSAHCFRCGPVGFEPHGTLSIEAVLERRRAGEALARGEVRYPSDFTPDIPTAARLWLSRAGVTAPTAEFYGIGYSPKTGRVVVPVYEDGVLVAVLLRSVNGDKPKYIANMRSNNEYFTSGSAETGTVVVTEDVLSAIRVGDSYTSIAMLGTAVSLVGLGPRLEKLGAQHVAVWLDPDKAGRLAARKLARAVSLAGWPVSTVRSDRDPKYYSNADIKEFVQGARHHTPSRDEKSEGV